MATLGARLRQLRRERGCTLQQVSDGSGLTPSFLSRLERGIVNISVGNLRKVAAYFEVPITYFFTEELLPHGMVIRPGQRKVHGNPESVLQSSLLPETASFLTAAIVTLNPGVEGEGSLAGISRGIYYVLDGEFVCTIRGHTHLLRKGDVLYQRRPASVRWSNDGPKKVVILVASLRSED